MSQSDYIRYKKNTNQLKEIAKLDPILASNDYIAFKQYTLESTVVNTSPTLNQLALPGNKVIFEMERNINNCPIANFQICKRTNLRSNRRVNAINSELIANTIVPLSNVNQHPTKTII